MITGILIALGVISFGSGILLAMVLEHQNRIKWLEERVSNLEKFRMDSIDASLNKMKQSLLEAHKSNGR